MFQDLMIGIFGWQPLSAAQLHSICQKRIYYIVAIRFPSYGSYYHTMKPFMRGLF